MVAAIVVIDLAVPDTNIIREVGGCTLEELINVWCLKVLGLLESEVTI